MTIEYADKHKSTGNRKIPIRSATTFLLTPPPGKVARREGVAEPLNSKSLRIDYSRQTLKLSDSDRIFGSREFKI